MHAVIIGATGATGREITEQLLNISEIKSITALVRRELSSSHPKLKQVITDFEQLESYSSFITGDIAYSCLGTTLKIAGSKEAQWKVDYTYQMQFAEICAKNSIPAFALISAMGANPKSKIFYSRMKGELEEGVKKLNFEKLLIAQPGPLIRPGSDRKMEIIMGKVLGFITAMGVLKRYTPVTTATLAKAVVANSLKNFEGVRILGVHEITSHF